MRKQRSLYVMFFLVVFGGLSLVFADSASFLKECNEGCQNTQFTFDSEQMACTLGCQQRAVEIGRLDASSGNGLTCVKAKLEMDKGLVRVGYDEYRRLDNFYDRYCK